MILDPRIPSGPITDKWDRRKFENKLVNPANRRKYQIIVVGTGLAGASAAASLGELGYHVKALLHSRQPAPRSQHRGAGRHQRREELPERRRQRLSPLLRHDQGRRLPRARGQRLPPRADQSVNIIDQCVAQGVPFAREYGGLLDNRSFGGAQVSRTFYARGQTGQQLLLGAYQSLMRQVDAGTRDDVPAPRDARPRRRRRHGARHRRRNLVTGEIESHDGRRGAALHRRLRQRLLPLDERDELERRPRPGARTSAAPSSPIPASRRSTRPASRSAAITSRS